jgi:hypothetical protein
MQYKIGKYCIRGWVQQDMGLQNEKGDPEEPPLMVQYQIKLTTQLPQHRRGHFNKYNVNVNPFLPD